ncbi:MAG: SpoIIE family protein phosphatase [Rubrobacteraceae bacterium]
MKETLSNPHDPGKAPRDFQRLLESAVEASSNGVTIADPNLPDTPIVYTNPAFTRITGYSQEEVLGRNCRFLQGGDRDQPVLEGLRSAVSEGREYRAVLKNYRKDGTQFWNELYVSPVYGEDGRLVSFVGVQNDITDRYRAEEEENRLLERERQARREAERSRRLMALVEAASRLLSSSLDYEGTLQRITNLFVPGMADWCLLYIVEDGVSVLTAHAHADPDKESVLEDLGNRSPGGEVPGPVAKVLDTGRPMLLSHVSAASPEELSHDPQSVELLRRLDPRSCMGVPLYAGGHTLGVLLLVSSNPKSLYDSDDLSLAAGLAHRCALALENARLYREHSYVTRTLQRGLLPRSLPEIPGVEVGVEYLSAGEDTEVGGDFYDLIDTNYDGWLCILGDVSGKGARAAAVTALTMYTLRAVAFQGDLPSAMFAALNEAMVRHDTGAQFCTAVCARLEPEEAPEYRVKLTLARAGHPPPLLLREGSVEEIGEPGKAIGVFQELDLEDYATHLLPGDLLALYTDGVIEARSSDGTFFGEERLKSLLGSCANLDAPAAAGRIRKAVLNHKEGKPTDDVAILVLRVTGNVQSQNS